jgi:hypothetical protein
MKPIGLVGSALTLIIAGCSKGDYEDSLTAKRLYSVLQGEEYRITGVTGPDYIFNAHATGTDIRTIAFPLRGKPGRYVVILANAKNREEILSVPGNPDFRVDRKALEEISRKRLVSRPVEAYLQEHAVPAR